ncbi:hypothetical protein CW304_26890 [Bacillus sp. UFRGS-B20]|nr:hypothetical protein CW304_26890 [Bacillus sp. UFRGS-B20]
MEEIRESIDGDSVLIVLDEYINTYKSNGINIVKVETTKLRMLNISYPQQRDLIWNSPLLVKLI